MYTVEKWYLIKHMHIPIIDCDCANTIKNIYNNFYIDVHRKLYHNHIYKWGYGKPNSDACNKIRHRLIYDWYNINIKNINYFPNDTRKILNYFNYDSSNINLYNEYKYKYKRMYKESLL